MEEGGLQFNRPNQISGLNTTENTDPDVGVGPLPKSSPGEDAESVRSIKLTPSSSRPMDNLGSDETTQHIDDRLAKAFWKSKQATITYCSAFWAFGMCVAFLGPTLRDLGCKTDSVTSTMSWIFFSQALFILIGSACGGNLIERFAVNPVLFISTVMLAVTLSLIPFCDVIPLLALVMAVMGFFMGIIDTVANVSMISLYGKMVAPFLQALHFFYGLGAFLSPMIAKPFLLNEDCTPLINNFSAIERNSSLPAKTLDEARKMTKVNYAFWVMAVLQIPVILLVTALLFKDLYITWRRRKNSDMVVKDSQIKIKDVYEAIGMSRPGHLKSAAVATTPVDDNHPPVSKVQVILMTGLTAVLLFLFDGIQAAYGGYVYSYAVTNFVEMSSSEAAYINSYFWGTFALGRLISIIIATKVSPGVMLFSNIVGCMLSLLIMLIWNQSRVTLYLGTCLFGAFLSSVYPTAVSLAQQYIHITSGITSTIVVGAAGGEMIFPVIVGHHFDSSPIVFLEIGFMVSLLSMFIYLAIRIVGSTIMRKAGSPGLLGAFLSLFGIQTSDSEGEDTGLVNRHVRYYSRMGHASESMDGDAEPEENGYGESIEINHEDYGNRVK